ncbi:MAG: hypothetical protein Ct9H300mP16_13690 [Pseudomonadota bacterium]|nr:MAG: hypothetical protein Ct9H300mP16_13690 [Pseudomonadota bacterium]
MAGNDLVALSLGKVARDLSLSRGSVPKRLGCLFVLWSITVLDQVCQYAGQAGATIVLPATMSRRAITSSSGSMSFIR